MLKTTWGSDRFMMKERGGSNCSRRSVGRLNQPNSWQVSCFLLFTFNLMNHLMQFKGEQINNCYENSY